MNTLFKCTFLISSNTANVLVPFHVINGYNHTSGFYGRGKISIFEKLQKNQEVQHLLQKFRESLKFSDDVRDDLRRFVICRGKETKYTEAKAAKIRKMKKNSLVRLLLMNLLHIITWIKLL